MKKRLLFVEDEAHTLRLYDEVFKEAGYEVFTAKSGVEALDILRKTKIDLVVTDVRMPDIDGVALIKYMGTFGQRMPVIVVTAYPLYSDYFKIVEKYVKAIYTKPMNMEILKMAVADVLKNIPIAI